MFFKGLIINRKRPKEPLEPPVPSPLMEARNLVVNQDAAKISIAFTFFHKNSLLENNKPPTAEDVLITGTATTGSILTAAVQDYFSRSGYAAGAHVYRWYSCPNYYGTGEVLLQSGTNNQYTITSNEVAKYIRVEVDIKQSGGFNVTGDAVTSRYTSRVPSAGFDPVYSIAWEKAFVPVNIGGTVGDQKWFNAGNIPGDAAKVTGMNSPTLVGGVLNFASASSQGLRRTGSSIAKPYEVWIRCRPSAVAAITKYILGFSTNHRIGIRADNSLEISNIDTGYDIVLNNWVVLRIVIEASSAKLHVNNVVINDAIAGLSTATIGSTQGYGVHSSSLANFYDGDISHIFEKDIELTSGEQASMWSWFNSNAPWN
jgi:hypothetical protein